MPTDMAGNDAFFSGKKSRAPIHCLRSCPLVALTTTSPARVAWHATRAPSTAPDAALTITTCPRPTPPTTRPTSTETRVHRRPQA